jgi:hypothetical protein
MLSGSGNAGVGGIGDDIPGAGIAPDGLVPARAAVTTLGPEHFQADVDPFAFKHARTLAPFSTAGGTSVALPAPGIATHLVTFFFLMVTVFCACH